MGLTLECVDEVFDGPAVSVTIWTKAPSCGQLDVRWEGTLSISGREEEVSVGATLFPFIRGARVVRRDRKGEYIRLALHRDLTGGATWEMKWCEDEYDEFEQYVAPMWLSRGER
ncbi:hypothetical protein A7982_13278 [Minicystis rosea]|nr:hypothetical protein A7982_13278 [Minicystis rosea]